MTFAFESPAKSEPDPALVDCGSAAKALRCCYGPALNGAYPFWIDNGSQTSAAYIIVKSLCSRPLRMVFELLFHPCGVHHPAVAQVAELLAIDLEVVVGLAQRIQCCETKSRHWQRNAGRAWDRMRQHDDPAGADVEGAGLADPHGPLQGTQRVLLVQELQPGVAAEHRRDQRPSQVARQRGLHRRTNHVGQSQDCHRYVGPTPAQPAGVTLDVEAVFRKAFPERTPAAAALGEQHRIMRA